MVAKLAELSERFKTEAGRAGAVVYEASSAEDASNYILKLAQERDVKNAVKSRSGVADKIKLSQRLKKVGIEVIDTDLKEWLARLAGGTPTGGKTGGQVEKLISGATGKKLGHDPRILLDTANRAIRQYCIKADMGISEADLAIAETGTLVIAGNEGVSRLVAVLPRIHITLIESRNLVPVMEDVFTKLKPLAAGQVVPGYVTYITGRNTTADIPGAVLARAQGPAEEHIILVNKAKRSTA